VDDSVSRLLAELERRGELDRTVVVFMARTEHALAFRTRLACSPSAV
jgi:membrane-anchored protein YejM (alkaline phosphatase superfamily)